MRAKYLLTTISVLSLGIAGNVLADDVYVNLSVLDNLQDSPAPVMRAKPLFPIISKSDSQKSVSAKKVRKACPYLYHGDSRPLLYHPGYQTM